MYGGGSASKAKGFWDNEKVVSVIEKGEREEIRVTRCSKNGREYVDVRTFYTDRNTGQLLPGKGASLPLDSAEVVAGAILQALDVELAG